MTFDEWWNADNLTNNNPYEPDSAAYWAWEGWQAAVLVERERCKAVLMAAHELSKQHHNYYHYMALQLDETAKVMK